MLQFDIARLHELNLNVTSGGFFHERKQGSRQGFSTEWIIFINLSSLNVQIWSVAVPSLSCGHKECKNVYPVQFYTFLLQDFLKIYFSVKCVYFNLFLCEKEQKCSHSFESWAISFKQLIKLTFTR